MLNLTVFVKIFSLMGKMPDISPEKKNADSATLKNLLYLVIQEL